MNRLRQAAKLTKVWIKTVKYFRYFTYKENDQNYKKI